jgi:hypothetical protein
MEIFLVDLDLWQDLYNYMVLVGGKGHITNP